MGIFRKTISSIAIFLCLASLVNLIISALTCFFIPNTNDFFLVARWFISIAVVGTLILKGDIVINNIKI